MARDDPNAPVTLNDVAREARVSPATASRALNGSSRKVADAYRDRVLAAAARLRYTPNLSAQATARGSSRSVALIVADIADPYFSSIAAGVIRGAEEAGLVVTMAITDRDSARELELVRAMRGQRPRVLILAGSRLTSDPREPLLGAELSAFAQSGGRVAFVSPTALPFPSVPLENYAGAKALALRLVELGYRRFSAITGPARLRTASDRLSGYLAGLAEHDLTVPESLISSTSFTRDGGYQGARDLSQSEGFDDVDLVFAVNDVMAVGAMSALRELGLTPGLDIGVAGYDDIPTVRDVSPGLTTVHIPLEEVGQQALRLALTPESSDLETDGPLSVTVVVRESTPPRTDLQR
ncbi:MAG TPA: LacI family DNA-binding transcriptional regulator [Pseudolysinimonas sp.]|nr:LacI family DNA-binding transcriptional regulator [Pseudolysinimonas sp.]